MKITYDLWSQVLSRNTSITLKFVLSHPELQWDWSPSITMEDILSRPEIQWNWECLSLNPSITLENVLNHPEKDWNCESLSENSSIFPNVGVNLKPAKLK